MEDSSSHGRWAEKRPCMSRIPVGRAAAAACRGPAGSLFDTLPLKFLTLPAQSLTSIPIVRPSNRFSQDRHRHHRIRFRNRTLLIMVQALICLFSKRDDITLREFKDGMETRFVPLLEKLTGPLFPLTYSRRYIAEDGNDRERHRSGPLGLPSLIVGEAESITWVSKLFHPRVTVKISPFAVSIKHIFYAHVKSC